MIKRLKFGVATTIKCYITISKNCHILVGYAVKFVIRNYSQNGNNYFENMLGKTANIRSNGKLYFKIFIIFDKFPYYENSAKCKKYDEINEHNFT